MHWVLSLFMDYLFLQSFVSLGARRQASHCRQERVRVKWVERKLIIRSGDLILSSSNYTENGSDVNSTIFIRLSWKIVSFKVEHIEIRTNDAMWCVWWYSVVWWWWNIYDYDLGELLLPWNNGDGGGGSDNIILLHIW